MINPVSNNLPSEYSSGVTKTSGADNNEHFSLDSALSNQSADTEDNGVIYEHSGNKNVSTGSAASQGNDTFENSLEKAIEKQNESRANEEAFNEEIRSIWNSVKGFFGKLFNNLKAIFGNIWDSKPINEGVTSMKSDSAKENAALKTNENSEINTNSNTTPDVTPSDTFSSDSSGTNSIEALEKSRDEQIHEALASGNKDEFRALISEDGKRVPARSTTILTTYDSNGRLVNIDPSDENKILHGNRGVKKL